MVTLLLNSKADINSVDEVSAGCCAGVGMCDVLDFV
jgi:hypothetical protein